MVLLSNDQIGVLEELLMFMSDHPHYGIAGCERPQGGTYPPENFEVRTDYSGRIMYGKQCLGITLTEGYTPVSFFSNLVKTVRTYQDEKEESNYPDIEDDDLYHIVTKLMDNCKTDQMGKGSIVYFPDIQVAEDFCYLEEDDEEDED